MTKEKLWDKKKYLWEKKVQEKENWRKNFIKTIKKFSEKKKSREKKNSRKINIERKKSIPKKYPF